jgi:hypothetical protein
MPPTLDARSGCLVPPALSTLNVDFNHQLQRKFVHSSAKDYPFSFLNHEVQQMIRNV